MSIFHVIDHKAYCPIRMSCQYERVSIECEPIGIIAMFEINVSANEHILVFV